MNGKRALVTLLLTNGVLSTFLAPLDLTTHCAFITLTYLSIYDMVYKQIPLLPALGACLMIATTASTTLLPPLTLFVVSIPLLLAIFPWKSPYLAPYDGLLCALIMMALPLEHISLFLCATGLFASAMAHALGSRTMAMVPPQWLAYILCTGLICGG